MDSRPKITGAFVEQSPSLPDSLPDRATAFPSLCKPGIQKSKLQGESFDDVATRMISQETSERMEWFIRHQQFGVNPVVEETMVMESPMIPDGLNANLGDVCYTSADDPFFCKHFALNIAFQDATISFAWKRRNAGRDAVFRSPYCRGKANG